MLSLFVYMKSCRVIEPHAALRRGAKQVAELMPARYVVMGHSHKPVMEPLGKNSTYINLGNWTADLADDHAPPAPCTHLVIRHGADGKPEATFCTWDNVRLARVVTSDAPATAPANAPQDQRTTAERGILAAGAQIVLPPSG
jgi:hypothetical protein